MLRIEIEYRPATPKKGKKSVIETLEIVNDATASDGSGDSERGNYDCTFTHRDGEVERCRVEGYLRSLGPWQLVEQALIALRLDGEDRAREVGRLLAQQQQHEALKKQMARAEGLLEKV